MEKTNEALFCGKCSLQFDKKIVYDVHLSFVHKAKDTVEIEEKINQIKEENEALVILCDDKKPKTNLVSLYSTHKKSKSHKCSICDFTQWS